MFNLSVNKEYRSHKLGNTFSDTSWKLQRAIKKLKVILFGALRGRGYGE